MVDSKRLHRHIEFLNRYVADLARYRDAIDPERFRRDRDLQYQVLFPLTMAIQSCIDVAAHVVAEGGLPRPETNADVFVRLADAGTLPSDLAQRLVRAAAARNLFVHRYWQIDADRVHAMLRDDLDVLVRFAAWAAALAAPDGPPGRE